MNKERSMEPTPSECQCPICGSLVGQDVVSNYKSKEQLSHAWLVNICEIQMGLLDQHKADWQTVKKVLDNLGGLSNGEEITLGWLMRNIPKMLKDDNGLATQIQTMYAIAQKYA
jgi:hypothetical protein